MISARVTMDLAMYDQLKKDSIALQFVRVKLANALKKLESNKNKRGKK